MAKIIGVRFRHAGKMYYFDPADLPIRYNDAVVVETARGLEYGTVLIAPMHLDDDKLKQPLKPVLRLATEEDTAKAQEYEQKETEAFIICREKIRERGLDMKLIGAEYAFDDSKLLFYFTADGRIDFRELVKDLAGIFRRRIELRQIGVRDETKILGGMGSCGRPLCCHTYLSDFAPVSIKMAKEQNLSLNPAKISGTCGRLMCCLNNEAETYAELKKNLPGKGDQATTPDGRHGEVHSVNILRQLVKIVVDMDGDEKELKEYHISEITFIPHSKRPKPQQKKKTEAEKAAEKAAAAEKGQDQPVTEEQRKYRQAIKKALENQKAEEAEGSASETPAEGGKTGRSHNRSRSRSGNRQKNHAENRTGEERPVRENNRQGRPSRANRTKNADAAAETSPSEGNQEKTGEGRSQSQRRRRPRHRNKPAGENAQQSVNSGRTD